MIYLVGGGGHAAVVLDALLSCRPGAEVRLFDKDPAKDGTEVLGFPVSHDAGALQALMVSPFVVAIGDNHVRRANYEALAGSHEALTVVHPRAVLSPHASVGAGSVVFAGAVVNARAKVGANAIVNTCAVVEHDCVLGDHAHLASGAVLGGGVSVGAGALVGSNATVLPGRHVGEWSVVGAGAIVTKDVPPGSVVKNVW